MFKNIKKIYVIALILFNFILLGIYPNKVNAEFRAGPASGNIEITCSGEGQGNEACGSDVNKLQLVGYIGDLYISVYSKPFNFIRTDNGGALQNGDWIPIGTQLNFTPYGDASGVWVVTGGGYDTPDMGTGEHLIPGARTRDGDGRIDVKSPNTSDPIAIDGTGSVSCSGWICVANSEGPASINVIFPGGTVKSTSAPKYPDQSNKCGNGDKDCGIDTENISYGNHNIIINFNVIIPNSSPTTNYINTSNVGFNNAIANWTYSDSDGDSQSKSVLQIATDSEFNNIVFNNSQFGSNTNFQILGLIPGTTYYPRVIVEDSRGAWSSWSNGTPFTTINNNPPDLNQLNCNGDVIDYTTGRINWSYLGVDEPGDQLSIKARYKRSFDLTWNIVNLSQTKSGVQDIYNLVSGYGYEIQISLNDNRNFHLGDRWKSCGTISTTNYPVPNVDFKLSKFGDSNTIKTNGQKLIVKSLEQVNLYLLVTNEIGLESCNINTVGGDNQNLFTVNGFIANINSNTPQIPSNDITYTVNLQCSGKPALNKRDINQSIQLEVLSYPIITCSVENSQKSVSESNPIVKINQIVLSNIDTSYTWNVKQNSNDTVPYINGNNPIPQIIPIDYTGLGFGKYSPIVEVTNLYNRTSIGICSSGIVNFGDSTIKEIK
jgi:hypothetical protein